MEERDVRSEDGTMLRCQTSGRGSTILLVHGALGSKESFALVEPLLAASHFVVTFDRRGRGESTDGQVYSIDREADDIVAVAADLGSPVHLVAHSFGATCSVLAVARGQIELASLALYEPPSLVGEDPSTWAAAVSHIEGGDYEAAMRAFAPIAGVSDEEVTVMMSFEPVWARICDAMPTLGRELDALSTCDIFQRQGPIDLAIRSLHLKGSETFGSSYVPTATLSRLFPGITATTMDGQGHAATATAPEQFASAVLSFVEG